MQRGNFGNNQIRNSGISSVVFRPVARIFRLGCILQEPGEIINVRMISHASYENRRVLGGPGACLSKQF